MTQTLPFRSVAKSKQPTGFLGQNQGSVRPVGGCSATKKSWHLFFFFFFLERWTCEEGRQRDRARRWATGRMTPLARWARRLGTDKRDRRLDGGPRAAPKDRRAPRTLDAMVMPTWKQAARRERETEGASANGAASWRGLQRRRSTCPRRSARLAISASWHSLAWQRPGLLGGAEDGEAPGASISPLRPSNLRSGAGDDGSTSEIRGRVPPDVGPDLPPVATAV